jgi:hypothetical protein
MDLSVQVDFTRGDIGGSPIGVRYGILTAGDQCRDALIAASTRAGVLFVS